MIDPRAAITAIAGDIAAGAEVSASSRRFHEGVAVATAAACAEAAERSGLDLVVLSGGVFQNRLLLERTSALLGAAHLRCSCPSGFRPTTAASASGRPLWRPPATASPRIEQLSRQSVAL